MVKKEFEVGLVLSGGAARGFAHLGVLKALEEKGMRPGIISGVSAGALVGALYADGYPPEEILQIYTRKSMFDFMEITMPRTGFFKATGIKNTLQKYLRAKTFEQLGIPLIVTATNLLEGKSEYFKSGNLIDPILASSCVPIMFEVIKINKVPYIDGGVMNNLPVEPIAGSCKKLIGVQINPIAQIHELKGLMQVAERSFHLAIASEMNPKVKEFDLFIEPEEISHYGLFDVEKAREIFDIGYKKAIGILTLTPHP